MKKNVFILLVIFICLAIISIFTTYAIYVDKYDTDSVFNVAKFKVLVNNEDITLETSKTFSIDNVTYKKSSDSTLTEANNKFAPGMISEAIISIDTSDVDVAFTYDLEIDLSKFNNDAIIIKYVNVGNDALDKRDNIYHGVVSLDQVMNDEIIDITVGIEWTNQNEDETDQEFNIDNEYKMDIPVSITVKQKME